MKYGVIKHKPGLAHIDKAWKYNIGDCMQSIAVEYLYERMGIKDYISVNRCDLSSYAGEYVVLPLASYLNTAFEAHFPLSPKIIPVFVGSCLPFMGHKYSNRLIQDFSRHQPIGCRDEMTMNLMRNSGMSAFVTGCVTSTLPRRAKEPVDGRVLFVDTPESLSDYVPEHIKKDAVILSHMFPIRKTTIDDEETERFHRLAVNQLELYKKKARLVVTSRLHCAVPCMASGIPVILVKDDFGPTFTWIDRYLPLYNSESFDAIDWNPEPVEYEERKRRIIDLFCEKISSAYEKYRTLCSVSDFYEKRQYGSFHRKCKKILHDIKETEGEKIKCAIWPPALSGYGPIEYIPKMFSQYSIAFVDDFLKKDTFGDIPILRSSEIAALDRETIFFITSKLVKDNAIDVLTKANRRFFVLC